MCTYTTAAGNSSRCIDVTSFLPGEPGKLFLAVVCENHVEQAHVNICAHCSAVKSVSMIGNRVSPANLLLIRDRIRLTPELTRIGLLNARSVATKSAVICDRITSSCLDLCAVVET